MIGHIGRLAHEKDLRTLFRAFRRLKSRYNDVLLLIVGEGREDIKSIFRNKEDVILAGGKDDVVPYYQALDVHALTSLTETANLSTLEAMSCGVAVVATPVGYVKEYVKDKKNGLLFNKKNSFSLYKKLELLKNSPELRKELGKNARKTVMEKFSWKNTVEKIKEVLEGLS